MNIWIFNHYAITPQYPGGTRHFELGRNLAARGHNVTIFASNFLHMNFTTVPIHYTSTYKVEDFDKFHFVWIKTPPYRKNDLKRVKNMLTYSFRISSVSEELVRWEWIEKPDIVIGSTVHPFAALSASSVAKKYHVPFIFEIRDLWPRSFIDMGIWKPSSPSARFFKWIEKITVHRAKKIIALSPETRQYLENQYRYPAADIHYIPNGVYVTGPTAPSSGSTLQALRDMKEQGFFLALYSGSLISTNKLETIIDAAQCLQAHAGVRFVLIGRGQEEERYHALIQGKGLSNISILSPVQKELVPNLLEYADVLILNQGVVLWGSSNKLYDYMASARPIISSVFARHNDIVTQVGGGISVPPENPQALAEAVLEINRLPGEQRNEMGRKNVEYVRQHHDWKILTDRLVESIEKILS